MSGDWCRSGIVSTYKEGRSASLRGKTENSGHREAETATNGEKQPQTDADSLIWVLYKQTGELI